MSLSSLEVSSRGASGSKGITVDKSSGAANLTARLRFIRGIDKAVIVAEVVAEEIEEEEEEEEDVAVIVVFVIVVEVGNEDEEKEEEEEEDEEVTCGFSLSSSSDPYWAMRRSISSSIVAPHLPEQTLIEL